LECGGWLGRQGARAVKVQRPKGLFTGNLSQANTEDSASRNPNCPLLRYQPTVHHLLQAKTSVRADSQHKRGMRDQVTDALELSLSQNSASQIVHSCYSAHVCKLQSDITSLSRHSFPRNAKAPKPLSRPARSERESQKKAQS
jgi:hypothetical protein